MYTNKLAQGSYNDMMNNFFLKSKITSIKYQDHLIQLPISNHSSHADTIIYAIQNKIHNLIILEEMGLGILLTDYAAKKLPYYERMINNDIYHKQPSVFYLNITNFKFNKKESQWTGCKVLFIKSSWDTSQWDYNKIKSLPQWITYVRTGNMDLQRYVPEIGKKLEKCIDIPFLEAMGVELPIENVIDNNQIGDNV